MNELSHRLDQIAKTGDVEKKKLVDEVVAAIHKAGYTPVEVNDEKPWGAYIRISGDEADRFVEEFFPGLTPVEARLGEVTAELSPKILIVSPSQRLSWQYHNRRAERWTFLTDGAYHKSVSDEQGELVAARKGDVIQFATGERHRLVGTTEGYTLVAEIWQHTDRTTMSNEEDIVRLADDYVR